MTEVMPPRPSVEERLQSVERILAAIRTEQRDGYRLAESVDRLGLNAGALQEALMQVDRNQQALTQLGSQLAGVEQRAATKTDLESTKVEQDLKAREFSSAALRRTYLIGLLLLAALGLGGLVTSEVLEARTTNSIRVCEQRNQQTSLIAQVLGRNGLKGDADQFQKLVIDCEKEFGR